MGLTPDETEAVHECISWCRTPGNNPVLKLYGTVHEKLVGAFGTLRHALRSIIPEGHQRARIRLDKRESRTPREAELGSTLGQERVGLVVVDASGHPASYQGLETLTAAVAKQDVIISADVPGPGGKGWARASGSIPINQASELDAQWREDLVNGTQVLVEETHCWRTEL